MRVTDLSPLPPPFIPLSSSTVALTEVGGKALNLHRLARAGFRVPKAFFIPTDSYRAFVDQNGLADSISKALRQVDPASPESCRAAADAIRQSFKGADVDPPFLAALQQAWQWLGCETAAVRSSATAEDLPDASFAGQQETSLNVPAGRALVQAIVGCWASLWSGRAISYRARNEIDQAAVALAVVVQQMIPSTAAGVMFTANPISGLRSESVIDATLGLGEALVSGQVEPDHFVIDRRTGRISERKLGGKALAIRPAAEGGIVQQPVDGSNRQSVPDSTLHQLAQLGDQVQDLFGAPQDIEWAYVAPAGNARQSGLYLLQSRPITTLYPVPPALTPDPPRLLLSFNAVQGLQGPMTPLGQDTIRLIFAGAARLFGRQSDYLSQGVVHIAGQRLWGDLTGIIRHPLGARFMRRMIGMAEPGSESAFERIMRDPAVGGGKGSLRPGNIVRLLRFALSNLPRLLAATRNPEAHADRIRDRITRRIEDLRQDIGAPANGADAIADAVRWLRKMEDAFVFAIPEIAFGAMAGMLPLLPVNRMASRLTGSNQLALELTRGLPNNITTEMDLSLWQTACDIRADPESRELLETRSAPELAQAYRARGLPAVADQALGEFLDAYGMRGLKEIDIGRPRWRDDPTPLIQTLQSYLKIDQPEMAPDAVFERGQQVAGQALEQLQRLARDTFAGPLKAWLLRQAARRIRALAGLREAPKFCIVQMMGIVRPRLELAGEALVRQGSIQDPEDIFFLYLAELEALAQDPGLDCRSTVADRRQAHRFEARRAQVPRLLLTDGRAFYEGRLPAEGEGGALRGSPVSPGRASGKVRVVLDPTTANLQPGEILVCPGTDPSWTPLFLAAAGLIMEVGGMMTHGAIVAREYGIPAIVGVDRATERLTTGERIEMDGGSGHVRTFGQDPETAS